MTKPNPGSPEAQEQGCLCPVMDNHAGEGFRTSWESGPMFWIDGDCPIHGKPKASEVGNEE